MCDHSQTVEVIHEGEVVCTGCGLVLHTAFAPGLQFADKTELSRPQDEQNARRERQSREFLSNICANNFLPARFAHDAETLRKRHDMSSGAAELAACMYAVLRDNNCPRSMGEIAQMSGVTTRSLWRHLSRVCPESNVLAKELAYPICIKLLIPHAHAMRLVREIGETEASNPSVNPLTIVAGCIYQYFKLRDARVCARDIAHACSVTPMSIFRFSRNKAMRACSQ